MHEQFVLAVCTVRAVFVLAHRRIWKLLLEPGLCEMVDCTVLHDEIAAVRTCPQYLFPHSDQRRSVVWWFDRRGFAHSYKATRQWQRCEGRLRGQLLQTRWMKTQYYARKFVSSIADGTYLNYDGLLKTGFLVLKSAYSRQQSV